MNELMERMRMDLPTDRCSFYFCLEAFYATLYELASAASFNFSVVGRALKKLHCAVGLRRKPTAGGWRGSVFGESHRLNSREPELVSSVRWDF